MPCFGSKPATAPFSTEPHARPHKDSHPRVPGGEMQGEGDMPSFGDYGVGDGGMELAC